jgi:hypothetical protein
MESDGLPAFLFLWVTLENRPPHFLSQFSPLECLAGRHSALGRKCEHSAPFEQKNAEFSK